jgi:hypothetical protein
MSGKWEFFCNRATGEDYSAWRWQWRQIANDGRVTESPDSFSTLDGAVANAREHGYTGPRDEGSVPPSHGRHIRPAR